MTREERIKKLMEEKMISYEEAAKIVDQELMDSYDYQLPSLTEDDKKKLSERAKQERFKKYTNTKLFQDLASNFQDLAKKEEHEIKDETYDEIEDKIANSKHAKQENVEQDTIDDTKRIVPAVNTTKKITKTTKKLSDEQLDAKIARAKHVKVKNTKKAKPKLVKKWKEMPMKKKVLSVVGVLVAAGAIVGIAATVVSNLMNGDASGVQAANDMLANSNSTTLHNAINQIADKGNELMSNFHSMADSLNNAIFNTDTTAINGQEALSNVDFSQQQFDPSTLSGQGEQVFTNANDAMNQTNSVVTNEWYQIDGADLIGQDGNRIDTAGMTNGEVQELLETGDYSVATTHGGVGMGFESSDQVLNHMQEAAKGGRTL